METLSKAQVMRVANLAKLEINEEQTKKYGVQLAQILTEIDKILNVEVNTDEILIAPTNIINRYSSDEVGKMLTQKEVFKNVNNAVDGYVVVPRVLND
jgi:aspartyl-tRNA(Asn)/glutamyl-tRNA(Gln) amidotransferase subunit C